MTCVDIGRGALCGGGLQAVRREPDKVRWCFKCRKHLMHDFVVLDYPEPSYYGPLPRFDCPDCHEDHTVGFGGIREWD